MFRRTLYLFLVTVLLSSLINAEEFLECENEPLGIFIAVPSNCTKAIYCNGADSTIVECDSNNPYFSSDDEMCYNNASVCGSRPFSEENLASTIPTVATTSAVTTTLRITSAPALGPSTFTAPAITVTSATAPIAATPTTTAPINLPSTAAPITSATIPTSSSSIDPFVSLKCPAVDDPSRPLFLPHPKSCSQYYLCYHGVATLMQCPNKLLFDVSQQSCNTAEKVNCEVCENIN